ncbi:DnaA regulatory inactivator Hda [Aliiglaciecola lipolytica]|uniref:DnaA-homolog protein n=1 Tax=Aliiglaciecola lipolytica E3 TaxID=1127673 RepID=K6YTB9_9ALTE|nr:DnaA regulatory inactivator Hda [Aliiglaciecola lipolytica]GAC14540.1 DnaA-homolog protein [Aliiglaciecola lipolytica E3]
MVGGRFPKQISLDVDLPDEQTFESLVVGSNSLVYQHCRLLLTQGDASDLPFLTYISGATATGKSHLLVALSHEAAQQNISHFYLALDQALSYPHTILEGMENIQLLCIDNLQYIQNSPEWQRALFDLINRIHETQLCKLVISCDRGPKQVQFALADLVSRLAWGISFSLSTLNDEDALKALHIKAKQRGISISNESLQFLISHAKRDMHSLVAALDELQLKGVEEKRRISIPFIKQVLDL